VRAGASTIWAICDLRELDATEKRHAFRVRGLLRPPTRSIAENVMKRAQLKELLLQSLEHERGGVWIYENALQCVRNKELKEEWQEYLEQTREHVQVLTEVCTALKLNAEERSPGAKILHRIAGALVEAMQDARSSGDADAAQLVACECVVLAETKDHLDWELIGEAAKNLKAEEQQVLQSAYERIEDQEAEHLYHTHGWCRELWLESLGLKAVLPPPEERQHVKTAIGAARAQQARAKMR
jgi:rubrerythrin